MHVYSPAFREGEQLPSRYTKNGENLSPPVAWEGLPENTRELLLAFEQFGPASGESFVHWFVYHIPPQIGGLSEGFKHKRDPDMPPEVLQGRNSLGNVGYDGPVGTIARNLHYRLRLFALDEVLPLDEGAEFEQAVRAIEGHVLAEGELNVDYQRKD
ncbi:YbhB/YbcL family Raf kinase inhibitor-like protein [Thiohalomonas denitrificans]|uniref:YbhB/YbcL family Raf kinase inhibitor-like protein n=1 Tax=Thiohalomonas denitrificans TaxID=415747 RepID=UPI0026ED6478|nr:YbhB/YbcL family Raf kinase inhibitor-like protein [Thiohalomonas denitrificans]